MKEETPMQASMVKDSTVSHMEVGQMEGVVMSTSKSCLPERQATGTFILELHPPCLSAPLPHFAALVCREGRLQRSLRRPESWPCLRWGLSDCV